MSKTAGKKTAGKNRAGKKAVLLTLICFLLAIPILALSIMVYSLGTQSESRAAELGKLERLNEMDYSVNQGFRTLFELTSGIIVSTNKTRVIIITEDLANPRRDIGDISTAFEPSSGAFADYAGFLETKYPDVKVRGFILQKMNSQLPLVIMPFGSVYKHNPEDNEVVFTPEKMTDIFNCTGGVYSTYPNCRVAGSGSLWPISYEVNLTVSSQSGAIEPISGCNTNSNCINIRINLKYNGGSETYTYAVFPGLTTSTYLNFQGHDDAIKITTGNPARLVIEETDTAIVVDKLSVKVRYADFKENKEPISISLPDNLFFIGLEDIDIVKAGTARLD